MAALSGGPLGVCVECGAYVGKIYTDHSVVAKGNIRLTKCLSCGTVADKYVEWEPSAVFIDVVLQKPQAWRHVLINLRGGRVPALAILLAVVYEARVRVQSIASSRKRGRLPVQVLDAMATTRVGCSTALAAAAAEGGPEGPALVACAALFGRHATEAAAGAAAGLAGSLAVARLLQVLLRLPHPIPSPEATAAWAVPVADRGSTQYSAGWRILPHGWGLLSVAVVLSSFYRLFFAALLVWPVEQGGVLLLDLLSLSSNVVAIHTALGGPRAAAASVAIAGQIARYYLLPFGRYHAIFTAENPWANL